MKINVDITKRLDWLEKRIDVSYIEREYIELQMKELAREIVKNLTIHDVSNNEVAVSCLNCHYEIAESYHDKMWCRDCKQYNHFKARTDC